MSWLLILMIVSLAANAFASIGSLVLNEIAWHDLEEYCKNRQKPKRSRKQNRPKRKSLAEKPGAQTLKVVPTKFNRRNSSAGSPPSKSARSPRPRGLSNLFLM